MPEKLKSRKFLTAAAVVIAGLASALVPGLELGTEQVLGLLAAGLGAAGYNLGEGFVDSAREEARGRVETERERKRAGTADAPRG